MRAEGHFRITPQGRFSEGWGSNLVRAVGRFSEGWRNLILINAFFIMYCLFNDVAQPFVEQCIITLLSNNLEKMLIKTIGGIISFKPVY